MSAYFLRADAHSICECIQAFGLDGLLFAIVAADGGAGGFPAAPHEGCPTRARPEGRVSGVVAFKEGGAGGFPQSCDTSPARARLEGTTLDFVAVPRQ